jgi:hypothetical protein
VRSSVRALEFPGLGWLTAAVRHPAFAAAAQASRSNDEFALSTPAHEEPAPPPESARALAMSHMHSQAPSWCSQFAAPNLQASVLELYQAVKATQDEADDMGVALNAACTSISALQQQMQDMQTTMGASYAKSYEDIQEVVNDALADKVQSAVADAFVQNMNKGQAEMLTAMQKAIDEAVQPLATSVTLLERDLKQAVTQQLKVERPELQRSDAQTCSTLTQSARATATTSRAVGPMTRLAAQAAVAAEAAAAVRVAAPTALRRRKARKLRVSRIPATAARPRDRRQGWARCAPTSATIRPLLSSIGASTSFTATRIFPGHPHAAAPTRSHSAAPPTPATRAQGPPPPAPPAPPVAYARCCHTGTGATWGHDGSCPDACGAAACGHAPYGGAGLAGGSGPGSHAAQRGAGHEAPLRGGRDTRGDADPGERDVRGRRLDDREAERQKYKERQCQSEGARHKARTASQR